MRTFAVILLNILLTVSVLAQDNNLSNTENVTDKVIKNEFEHLISPKTIVYQLRKNYGIKGSVLLSKTLWQILSSYSNQQQAQNIWKTSINNVTDIRKNSFSPLVNFQFTSAQILSKYTHGMNLEKWHKNRFVIDVTRNNISDFLNLNDDLTIYMQLNNVWEIILIDIIKQEGIIWNDVFMDSINLFAHAEQLEKDEPILTNPTNLQIVFFKMLIIWEESDSIDIALADLMVFLENSNQVNNQLYRSIIRFGLNKHYQHYLATSLNWLEVAYRLKFFYNNHENIEKDELQIIVNYIEQNDAWFLSKESQLLIVDESLPVIIESSIHNLKAHYRNENNDLQSNNLAISTQLIEPMLNKYMAIHFRQRIQQNLEICLNISEEFSPYPQLPIDAKQFSGCIQDMAKSATVEAKIPELSGSLTKVDTKEALDRALKLPAWQNINFLYAKIARNDCLNDSKQLANPLEWSLAAESILWFADRWPAYVMKYPQNNYFNKVIATGENLSHGFDCLDKSESEILLNNFVQINQAWEDVKTQIKLVTNEFNQLNLTSGSDIDLLSNFETKSTYKVEDYKITACDAQKSCGVHVAVDSSRAIFGLFPNHLLIADQLKQGHLKLCYDNVGWENRRSASTHLDNDSVANYFANFSFNIKGFYDDTLIFERKVTSKQEYHYLFAENNDEVLSTYCPLSIVGSNISTKLERGTFGLVPNRLTFLTASRVDESKILTSNWSAGEEWRDKISGQDTDVISENNLLERTTDIQLAYRQKATKLQDLIYQAILNRIYLPSEQQKLLSESFKNMDRMTKLFSQLLYALHAEDFMANDKLHGIIFGAEKIPDILTVNEYYRNQFNINQLITSIDENMNNNQNNWNTFTSYWSNTYINNILYRLKSLKLR